MVRGRDAVPADNASLGRRVRVTARRRSVADVRLCASYLKRRLGAPRGTSGMAWAGRQGRAFWDASGLPGCAERPFWRRVILNGPEICGGWFGVRSERTGCLPWDALRGERTVWDGDSPHKY
jgi:hypothetical protein